MPITQVLWIASLAVEFGVVVRILQRAWYRLYPRFLAYLLFDLSASLFLFWINLQYPSATHPFLYDLTWRITQLFLLAGRVSLLIESYQRLASVPERWRFSDGLVYPAAGMLALLLHLIVVQPYRWPDSSLETVFGIIASGHAMMGFSLIGILVSANRQDLRHTVQFQHAAILCLYLLLTCGCYYSASQHPETAGVPLMATATLCYSSWFICLVLPHPLFRKQVNSLKQPATEV